MTEIHFTSHLRNLVPDRRIAASGVTVGEALDNLVNAHLPPIYAVSFV
jgi:hypothetical protein